MLRKQNVAKEQDIKLFMSNSKDIAHTHKKNKACPFPTITKMQH